MSNNIKHSYQKLFGTFDNGRVPDSVRDKKNKEKSWSYGYNEEYDFVCVSKDGTLGDIYVLQNLAIGLPLEPEDKTTIRDYNKPHQKQLWHRFNMPAELLNVQQETTEWNSRRENKDNLKTPTEIFFMKPKSFITKYSKFIDKDFERREFGFWQMINNKAFWIPNKHYYFLQHIPVKGNIYPDFRFSNRDFYLFWSACIADNRSMGLILTKNRRSGISTIAGSENLNIGTQIEEGFLGIMSKTARDSVSFLNKMVIRPFKKLPWYFQPQTSGTTSATSGLNFKEISKKISSKNTVMAADEGLDTSIKQFSTSLHSMDGELVHFMTLDEASKYATDVPFNSYWSIAKTCLTEGFKIVGKAMVVSTVNDLEKGGKAYREIYYASDVMNRGDDGRTVSGLYSFFLPSQWCMEGGYDIFGYSVVESPTRPIRNRDGDLIKKGNLDRLIEDGVRLKKQSAVLYSEYLRQFPRTIAHAFRDPSSSSDFNLLKIEEQLDYNEMFFTGSRGADLASELYERGNFVNNAKTDGEYDIQWIPTRYGRFFVSWIPPVEMRNNFEKRGGVYFPMNDFGCFGVDTYKIDAVSDSRGGSKAAMHGITGDSMDVSIIPDNEFFLEYIEKPKTVEMFMTDMIHAMLYYGIPSLIESNVPNLLEKMKRENLTGFALRRRDKVKLNDNEKKFGGIPMVSVDVVQKHYFAIQTYIEKYVGEDDDGIYRDEKQMGKCPFNRMISSWRDFNPKNRTKQDASISSGLAIMGAKMMFSHNKSSRKDIENDLFRGFYSKEYSYSNSDIGI